MTMELFTIERYVGDSPLMVHSSAKESQRLAELLQEARGRRKRLRESLEHSEHHHKDALPLDSDSPSKKKKNKKKKDKKEKILKHLNESEANGNDECIGHDHEPNSESNKIPCTVPVVKLENKMVKSSISGVPSTTESLINQEERTKEVESLENSKLHEEMTVIGKQAKKQTPKPVRRILPKWLAYPHFFSNDVQHNLLPVSRLQGLDKELINKLQNQDIRHFFPVQQVIIPEVLSCWEGKNPFGKGGFLPPDLCVCAPTGSGKTLAYVLPIIQLLKFYAIRRLEALIVAPTKDLATQVWSIFSAYVQGTNLKVGLANGLKSLQREQEQLGMKR